MRLDIVPESLVERLLVFAGMIPQPLAHTMLAILMSRTILTAAKIGVFRALAKGPVPPDRLAATLSIDGEANRKLLRALSSLGYIREGVRGVELTAMTRRWLGGDAGKDLTDALLHRFLDIELMENAEAFVRTGTSLDFHDSLSEDEWRTYMNGQRAQALLYVPELLKRTDIPRHAASLLDLGGGHGLFADAACRKYPNLRAVVLDLPGAIDRASRTDLSDRVEFRAGNLLDGSLDVGMFDVVFIGNVLHHFDSQKGRRLVANAVECLVSGGICVVADFFDRPHARSSNQIPALLDFYFAVTSGGGTLKYRELKGWMEGAGLQGIRVSNILPIPGMRLVRGTKTSRL